MKITIERVENGFVLSWDEYNDRIDEITGAAIDPVIEKKRVFGGQADEEDNFAEYGKEMFWELLDLLGLSGTAHNRDRVQVVIVAGDKYEPRQDEELVALDLEYVRMKK